MGLTEQRPILISILPVKIKLDSLYAAHTIETFTRYLDGSNLPSQSKFPFES